MALRNIRKRDCYGVQSVEIMGARMNRSNANLAKIGTGVGTLDSLARIWANKEIVRP